MSARTSRRQLLVGAVGLSVLQILAACSAPPAPTAAPTAAPAAKPPEVAATKPAAPAAAATTASAPAAATAAPAAAAPASAGAVKEAVHWYTWTASDGDIWKQALDEYNAK